MIRKMHQAAFPQPDMWRRKMSLKHKISSQIQATQQKKMIMDHRTSMKG
jgi:hypothetical protein